MAVIVFRQMSVGFLWGLAWMPLIRFLLVLCVPMILRAIRLLRLRYAIVIKRASEVFGRYSDLITSALVFGSVGLALGVFAATWVYVDVLQSAELADICAKARYDK